MFCQETIINIITNHKNPSFYFLVKKLNVGINQNKQFSSFLNELKKKGLIAFSKKNNCFYVPKLVGSFITEISIKNTDYGFVSFVFENDEKKAIVFNENLNNSLNGDKVSVNVYYDLDYDKQFFAVVISIQERKNKFIFGTINENFNFIPINFNKEYFFFDTSLVNKNTYVKFQIKSVIRNKIYLEFKKEISKVNEPYSDINLLIESVGIISSFNQQVINESELIPKEVLIKSDEYRKDLTNELVVTIDGEKTKDFDDAISIYKNKNDNYILGVHIADVAYYVKENSEIDKEALRRSTSIYLIDKVIPMLPEILSNGICSLNPDVYRYTLTLQLEINKDGKVIKKQLFPSCIKSKYRLTYNQVENYQNDPLFKNDKNLFKLIDLSFELSQILSKIKHDQGYIDFEIEESVIDLDKNGKTINLSTKKRLSSEVLIENFMILANEQVSKMVTKQNIPNIYRIHEVPSDGKFDNLRKIIKSFDDLGDVKIKNSPNPKVFLQTIKEIKKHRFDNFIKIILLRTMQKAKYSSNNIGHFGLASKCYSHFTSPIRRYADLQLHRIIWEIIIKKNMNYLKNLKEKIDHVSAISTKKEEEALFLERKVNDVKKSEFYELKLNQVLVGKIVSIQKFGIFVEFDDKVDAFVHISNLSKSKCLINEWETQISCTDENKHYKIGEEIKVKIISIDKLEGKIDAKLA